MLRRLASGCKISFGALCGALALWAVALRVLLVPVPPHDFWWHMAQGRAIAASGRVPAFDSFSWTRAGAPFFDQSWLAQWVFFRVHEAGGVRLLIFAQAALVLLAYALLWAMARARIVEGAAPVAVPQAREFGARVASLVLLAVTLISFDNWLLRPQTFVLPLFALWLWTLERWRTNTIAAAPLAASQAALMMLWANSHGSFPLALLLNACALLSVALEAWNLRHIMQNAPPQAPNSPSQAPNSPLQVPNGAPQAPTMPSQVPNSAPQVPNSPLQVLNSPLQVLNSTPQVPNAPPQAADGTPQAAEGASQAADGASQAADGAPQVPNSPPQVPNSPLQVPNSPLQVPNGAPQAADGASQVPNSAPQVPTMPSQVPNSTPQAPNAPPQAADGASQAANSALQAADGASQVSSRLRQAAEGGGGGRLGALLAASGAAALATVVNPRGVQVLGYVARMLVDPSNRFSAEWLSPTPRNIGDALFFLFALVLFVALAHGERRPWWLDSARVAVFFWLAITSGRYIVWFGLVAALPLASVLAARPSTSPGTPRRAVNGLAAALMWLLLVPLLPWFKPALGLGAPLGALLSEETPVRAARVLAQMKPRRLWHNAPSGSYLIWAAPGVRVWIDTRFELYPPPQWRDCARAQAGDAAVLDKYRCEAALVDRMAEPALDAALGRRGWKQSYRDARFSIWQRPQPGQVVREIKR